MTTLIWPILVDRTINNMNEGYISLEPTQKNFIGSIKKYDWCKIPIFWFQKGPEGKEGLNFKIVGKKGTKERSISLVDVKISKGDL